MDTLFTILYGIFTLGILILVHELGHFIAGKLTGIRVTGFSIGFGRGIFSFDHKGTHYKIGWLPVGGYCRFAGEGEDLSDDRKGEPDEFYERPAWARLITVSAGVFFNFVFGIFIYWVLALSGSSYVDTDTRVTVVDKKLQKSYGPAFIRRRPNLPALAAGLQHGDRIVSIDGKKVRSFRDMRLEVMSSGKESLKFEILRNGKLIKKTVVIALSSRTAGYLNVGTWAPPIVGGVASDGIAWKSGLRPGDYIHKVGNIVVRKSYLDLFRVLKTVTKKSNLHRRIPVLLSRFANTPDTLAIDPAVLSGAMFTEGAMAMSRVGFRLFSASRIKGLRNGDFITAISGKKVFNQSDFMKLVKSSKLKTVVLTVFPGNLSGYFPGGRSKKVQITAADLVRIKHYRPPVMAGVLPGSGLYRLGMRSGDVLVSLGGQPVYSVNTWKRSLKWISGRKTVEVRFYRRKQSRIFLNIPAGASSLGVHTNPLRYIFITPSRNVVDAIGYAFGDFAASFSRIVKGLSKLFYKESSIRESAGGPISLVGLSGRILKEGSFRNWLELLALLSIAIGFMNLLPIPALDGGHIILNIIELIRRKRMSFKVLHRIQLVGISILFTLFFFIILLDVLKLDKIF